MKIQSTATPIAHNPNFGQKHPSTKLPANLNLKPRPKAPSGFFIGLMSAISLLAGGTLLYRQTYQYKFQSLLKEYQNNLSEIKLDSTCTKQDSIDCTRKRDSLTIDFLKKLAELKPAQSTNTADTAYINLTDKRASSYAKDTH